jgi:hypothetical protein
VGCVRIIRREPSDWFVRPLAGRTSELFLLGPEVKTYALVVLWDISVIALKVSTRRLGQVNEVPLDELNSA